MGLMELVSSGRTAEGLKWFEADIQMERLVGGIWSTDTEF